MGLYELFDSFLSSFRSLPVETDIAKSYIAWGDFRLENFEIRECFVPQKLIFDLSGKKSPDRMVSHHW